VGRCGGGATVAVRREIGEGPEYHPTEAFGPPLPRVSKGATPVESRLGLDRLKRAVTGRSSRPREIGRVRLKRARTIPLRGAGACRRSASVKQRCGGTNDLSMIRREARPSEVANERDT
jgi:hypothetical protein